MREIEHASISSHDEVSVNKWSTDNKVIITINIVTYNMNPLISSIVLIIKVTVIRFTGILI